MNKQKILDLADFIENLPPKQFNMAVYGVAHECGTIACIAGWAAVLEGATVDKHESFHILGEWIGAHKFAAKALGINEKTSLDLFTPIDEHESLSDITKEQAVKTLRKLAETGEVDWS